VVVASLGEAAAKPKLETNRSISPSHARCSQLPTQGCPEELVVRELVGGALPQAELGVAGERRPCSMAQPAALSV
jgi:hypothetical protein